MQRITNPLHFFGRVKFSKPRKWPRDRRPPAPLSPGRRLVLRLPPGGCNPRAALLSSARHHERPLPRSNRVGLPGLREAIAGADDGAGKLIACPSCATFGRADPFRPQRFAARAGPALSKLRRSARSKSVFEDWAADLLMAAASLSTLLGGLAFALLFAMGSEWAFAAGGTFLASGAAIVLAGIHRTLRQIEKRLIARMSEKEKTA